MRIAAVLPLCLALGLAVPAGAAAQPADEASAEARDEARERFERGVGLMRNENWETALLEFERSLEAYPTRSALFNLAMCQKALHRYRDALGTLERWRTAYAGEAPEADVETVRATVEELRGYLAELVIAVEPEGATVLVDGEEIGVAPLAGPLTVDAGRHTVAARREGYEAGEREVVLATEERLEVALALAPLAVEPPPVEPPPVEPPPVEPPPVEPPPVVGVGPEPGPEPPVDEPSDGGVHAAAFWTLAGAAVAAGIGGAVTGVLLLDKEDQVNGALDDCRALDRDACDRGPGLIEEYETLQAATNGLLFGAGAVALAAVAIAFFTDFGFGDGEAPPVQVTAGPAGTDGSGAPTGMSLGVAVAF